MYLNPTSPCEKSRFIRSRLRLARCVMLASLSSLLLATLPARAQLLYWDSNGATTGAGATPTGIWGTDLFWSTDPLGELATAGWTIGGTAIFSAGADASGAFTVNVSGTQTAGGMLVEEGAVSVAAGTVAVGKIGRASCRERVWIPV